MSITCLPSYVLMSTLSLMRCMLGKTISTINLTGSRTTLDINVWDINISRLHSWRWTDTLNVGNTLHWMGDGNFQSWIKERGLRISMLLSLLPGWSYHVTSHLQLLLLFLHCWDGPYPQLWAKINPSFWDCSYLGLCHNQKSNTHVLFLSTSDLLRMCMGSVMTQDRKEGSRAGGSSYGRSYAS